MGRSKQGSKGRNCQDSGYESGQSMLQPRVSVYVHSRSKKKRKFVCDWLGSSCSTVTALVGCCSSHTPVTRAPSGRILHSTIGRRVESLRASTDSATRPGIRRLPPPWRSTASRIACASRSSMWWQGGSRTGITSSEHTKARCTGQAASGDSSRTRHCMPCPGLDHSSLLTRLSSIPERVQPGVRRNIRLKDDALALAGMTADPRCTHLEGCPTQHAIIPCADAAVADMCASSLRALLRAPLCSALLSSLLSRLNVMKLSKTSIIANFSQEKMHKR